MEWLLLLAVLFVAYSNGANDNFKGVAALYGSRTTSYRTALTWATIATFAGSICAVVLAQGLLRKFSGKGLVPDVYLGSEAFLAAVALGAALTVLLATLLGFPISTTHALTGGIVGAGFSAAGTAVNFAALGSGFLLPLLLSPMMACGLCVCMYLAFRGARLITGISKEWCVCVGGKTVSYPVPQPNSILSLQPAFSVPDVKVSSPQECSQHYSGSFLGVRIQKLVDGAHFLSAGLVSFARGLNDTPKIAGLLLLVQSLSPKPKFFAIAAVMAVGGLWHSRRIANTMSMKITQMNHGQAFAASVATGLLVSAASLFSLPVSTTHVSVGALFGIGVATRQANLATIRNILLAWLITLPTAGVLSALIYMAVKN